MLGRSREEQNQRDLAALRTETLAAVEAVLAKGHYILGPNVAAFEQEVAAFCGAKHGIGVNSGSDALTLARHVTPS